MLSRLNGSPAVGLPRGSPAAAVALARPERVTFRCYVYFDKDLTPNVLHVTDWKVKIDARWWNLSGPIAEISRVRIDTDSPGPFSPGGDRVVYTNLHNSLRDVDGLAVDSFFYLITRTD